MTVRSSPNRTQSRLHRATLTAPSASSPSPRLHRTRSHLHRTRSHLHRTRSRLHRTRSRLHRTAKRLLSNCGNLRMSIPRPQIAALRSRPKTGRSAVSGRRGEEGIIALEWLLIVGAVAGLAATASLAVQQVADDVADVQVEPAVRFIDAEIAAAAVGDEATAWRRALKDDPAWQQSFGTAAQAAAALALNPVYVLPALHGSQGNYDQFERRCLAIPATFDDVVDTTNWHPPEELGWAPSDPKYDTAPKLVDALLDGEIKQAARCEVTPRAGLRG